MQTTKNLAHYNEEVNVDYNVCINRTSCPIGEESLKRMILSITELESILHLIYSIVIRNKSALHYIR
jgi:hypothetical protein